MATKITMTQGKVERPVMVTLELGTLKDVQALYCLVAHTCVYDIGVRASGGTRPITGINEYVDRLCVRLYRDLGEILYAQS